MRIFVGRIYAKRIRVGKIRAIGVGNGCQSQTSVNKK